MFQTEKGKTFRLEDLSSCCGKALWICSDERLGQTLQGLHTEKTAEGPEKMQVGETSFLNPELGLAGRLQTHSLQRPQPQPKLRLPRLPWSLLASALQLSAVVCLGLVGRHRHTLSGSPYLIFCCCALYLLQAVESALCLPHAHMVLREPGSKLCQS